MPLVTIARNMMKTWKTGAAPGQGERLRGAWNGQGSGPPGAGLHRFLKSCLQTRWRKYRKALKGCRKKFTEDSVHDLRIETRRMLALLSVLHPFIKQDCLGRTEKQFKKLFKSSARLRDTQVQLGQIQQELKSYPEMAIFYKALRRSEGKLAQRFKKKVSRGLKPKLRQAFGLLRGSLRSALKDTAAERSHSRLLGQTKEKAWEKVLGLRQAVRPNQPATIHRLRIAFKAYRYIVETLQPVLPGVTRSQLSALQRYQAFMGEIQDAQVLLGRLEDFDKSRGETLARFRAELERRHAALIKRFLAAPLPSRPPPSNGKSSLHAAETRPGNPSAHPYPHNHF